jgi:hypothetical protein
MNVHIHIDRLCLSGVDERTAREVLARLEGELRARAASAGWRNARIAVLRAHVRGAQSLRWPEWPRSLPASQSLQPPHPAQLARALADALLGSAS